MHKVFILQTSEIPYSYWGMESSSKGQELDPAPVTKKPKLADSRSLF